MRYDDPKLASMLAGEYVLGTLPLRARRRFEALQGSRPALMRAVAEWEERLAALSLGLPPVTPPARVWQRLSEQLGFAPPRPEQQPSPRGLLRWRALAAVLALVAVALGVERLVRAPEIRELERRAAVATSLERELAAAKDETARLHADLEAARQALDAPARIAVVADAAGKPLWVVRVAARELRINAVGAAADQPGKSYELWMLPDGGAPVSLGVLPSSGALTVSLADAAVATLAHAPALAVSLEPAGGSPTGQPTGPVLYSAPLLEG